MKNKRITLVSIIFSLLILNKSYGNSIHVGIGYTYPHIKEALAIINTGDTLYIHKGLYKEGNITIEKSITVLGIDKPILDGEGKYEVLSVKASNTIINGLVVQHSGIASLEDPGGIKVYNSQHVRIENNILNDNFFGIYIQYGKHCIIKNNIITAHGEDEQMTGNGIHCWKSDSLQIIANTISGHRDGIYFEFVTNSVIWRNISFENVRYGLHFMFSNSDAYISNVFKHNGAGVAVMFSHHVTMLDNTFELNWGDAAYGLLLKEISDSYMMGNRFEKNTIGIFMEGASRMQFEKSIFLANGWGVKIQASCMDNVFTNNNFLGNTFDVGTNGTLVLNTFKQNYWDKYEGYDLNKDNIGDVPFHPLSLFSVIVEKNPPAMLLYRSMITGLLDKTEKVIPSLTPSYFIDNEPLMKELAL